MGRSETCLSLDVFDFFLRGTLMLKVSLLVSFANMIAGLFGKSEGSTWS